MGGPDQYAFTLEPHLPVDYEPANHYSSTHPDSRFVQTLTAQLPTPKARYFLRNRELVTVTQSAEVAQVLPDDPALLEVLEKRFGIVLPAGTAFGELPRTPAA
jgi:N-hydroxyarylamine O-acetyltransferase